MKDMNPPPQPGPSDVPGLLNDLLLRGQRILHNEVALARKEIGNNLSRAGVGLALVVLSMLVVLSALHVLAAAAVAALIAAGVAPPLASLIVAALALALAAVLFFIGKARLSPKALAPRSAFRSLRRDVTTIKENAHV